MNKERLLSAAKKHKRALLIVAALLGALLMIFPTMGSEEVEGQSLDEYKRALEDEIEDMLSMMEGVGRCSVCVTFSDGERYTYSGSRLISTAPPRVLGIGVVCEGGGSPEVCARISDALSAVFDVGANRVSVSKMKK